MNRRTAIKRFLATSLFGISVYSGCSRLGSTSEQNESLYFYKGLIADLAETIIPTTDSPGAKDAKVEDFIIRVLIDFEDTNTRNRFLSGLRNLEEYAKKNFNKDFQSCSLSDKHSILGHYEKKDFKFSILNKIEERLFGESFFSKLKHLTVVGFCTSELGATQALSYDYIPVNYQACIPLLKGQKSWATH